MSFKVSAKNENGTKIDFISSGEGEELRFHTIEEAEEFIDIIKKQGALQAAFHYSIEKL